MSGREKVPLKLYISGPITGLKEGNRPLFDEAKKFLLDNKYEVVSPFDIDATLTSSYDGTYWKIIGKDLEIISTVDGIVLLNGWYRSVGARLEVLAGLLTKKQFFDYVPGSVDTIYTIQNYRVADELSDNLIS